MQTANKKLNYVIVGAHPDDCEIYAGGLTILLKQAGHNVSYVVTCNGNAGHFRMSKEDLKIRRFEESRKVAACLGINYEMMDNEDGWLEPSLKNRKNLIGLLRKYQPDVIITHQTDDYHPDHRYTSQLVADTAFMLNVPMCVPDVPAMNKPVLYCQICLKTKIGTPMILIPVESVIDRKLEAVHQNTSQIYEWLPWIEGTNPDSIGSDEQSRRKYLNTRWRDEWERTSAEFQNKVSDRAVKKFQHSKFIEAFSASPWGLAWSYETANTYFPLKDCIIL